MCVWSLARMRPAEPAVKAVIQSIGLMMVETCTLSPLLNPPVGP